jgi:hypothetical protein
MPSLSISATLPPQEGKRTLLSYTLATREFRKSCQKQFLDELTKQDLTDFLVFQKKQELADRTIDNRLTDLGTFLHANNVALSLHQSYTEKKVRAYSIEELRALNATSTDEELQVWQFFLSTGFREDEAESSREERHSEVSYELAARSRHSQ